jgi:hypothetical protein
MPYELHREMRDGQLCRLSIGLDLVDDYPDFLRCRCRPNTWVNYAHDLKIFFNTVGKPVAEVSTADVFCFIRCQSQGQADPGLVWSQDWRFPRILKGVRLLLGRFDGFPHRRARVFHLFGNSPDTPVFMKECSSDFFSSVHLDHLLLRYHRLWSYIAHNSRDRFRWPCFQ